MGEWIRSSLVLNLGSRRNCVVYFISWVKRPTSNLVGGSLVPKARLDPAEPRFVRCPSGGLIVATLTVLSPFPLPKLPNLTCVIF
jgi:hypothetical protein